MVEKVETLLILLGIVGMLAVVAEKLKFPFPILLVIAGLIIGFVPGLPDVTLDPDLVFIIFLPPLIFSAAWNFPWEEFRRNLIPIFALAVGLVFATMTGVAYASSWLIPGFTLASGFVLGAIISPPDAVAANAVLKRVRIPRRLSTILEGESLVNDASGLVAYQFAVAAVVTGSFSFAQASGDFVWDCVGGILFGYLVGLVIDFIHRGLRDPAVEVTLTILTPYIAYLPCEPMGCSGVLAVVTAGLHLGHRSWQSLTPESRLQRDTIWQFIDYLLNGIVFILIGLQFPAIIKGLQGIPVTHLVVGATVICFIVIAIRFLWIIPLALIQKRIIPQTIAPGTKLTTRGLVVASWAGMRGVVSLAAALALPLQTDSGEEFPFRHLILFLTFAVIFVTLVIQGLSLPWLARKLKVEESREEYEGEAIVRMRLLESVVEEIDRLAEETPDEAERSSLKLWHDYYSERALHVKRRLDSPLLRDASTVRFEMDIFPVIIGHVRESLARMRRDGSISEDMRRRIEYDFDIEQQRIQHLLGRYRGPQRKD